MRSISNETLLRQLNWRYATKKFDPKRKVAAEDWETLEKALVLTASSWGLQPWKFFVVTDPATKEKLLPASYHQRQVVEGSHVVAFAIRENVGAADVDQFLHLTAQTRGVPVEQLEGFRKVVAGFLEQPAGEFDVDEWAARQVYLALGNFLTCAAMMGIDTSPLEGIVPAKYDEVLGLQGSGHRVVVACVAGYRAEDDKYARAPKVRYALDEMITRI